ncbi:Phosphatidylglycerol/phosphatidylinositol transfer protein [Arachnomyces sp. PD_36]|nr:Phosphatidylglycerol/phosphatidylinositol transfer protein [Arachnomyces sp. PD_36]
MQLISISTAVLALLIAPITVSGRSILREDQSPIVPTADTFPVPGNNPLLFCNDPKDDILTIENVDLSPNPPVPGQTLTIKAHGTLAQDVEEGAKVQLQVKYGLIRLVNQEADLCEQIKNVDMSCPLKKGPLTITKEVDIPSAIPGGKYSVLADANTKDNERLTCLEATVTF